MYHCVGNAGRHRTQAWRTTSDIRPHGNSEHTTPPRRRNQHNDAKCWPNGKDERARTIAVMKVTHRRLRCHQHVIALGGAPSPHKCVLSLHMHMPTHLGRTLDLCCGRSCWLRSTQLPHQTFRHLWRPHMKMRRSRTRKTRPRRRGSGSCVDCRGPGAVTTKIAGTMTITVKQYRTTRMCSNLWSEVVAGGVPKS